MWFYCKSIMLPTQPEEPVQSFKAELITSRRPGVPVEEVEKADEEESVRSRKGHPFQEGSD